jgi:hypothetical protein
MGDDGDRYGGWVVAQGEEFFEWLMRHPTEARRTYPSKGDFFHGETVYFTPPRIWREGKGKDLWEIADPYEA